MFARRTWLSLILSVALLAAVAVASNCTTTAPKPKEPAHMTWEAWVTVSTCGAMLLTLSLGLIDCAPCLVIATTFLYLCGIISITQLFAGLGNTSVVTVGLLCICVDPIADLPLVKRLVGFCLRGGTNNGSVRMPLFKVITMCLLTSSFLNNTPQVAMLTTLIKNFCRQNGLYPSQLLLPMNYATLCGNYAIIGTSTNLIVDGLMKKAGMRSMPFFELMKINGPFTLVMVLYLVYMPSFLLPFKTGLARAKPTKDTMLLLLARVSSSSGIIGVKVSELLERLGADRQYADILQIVRGTENDPHSEPVTLFPLTGDETIAAGDLLTVQADRELLASLAKPWGLEWQTVEVMDHQQHQHGHAHTHTHGTDSPTENEMQPSMQAGNREDDREPLGGSFAKGSFGSRPTGNSMVRNRSSQSVSAVTAGGGARRRANSLSTRSPQPEDTDCAAQSAFPPSDRHHLMSTVSHPTLKEYHHRPVAVGDEYTEFFEVVASHKCPLIGRPLGSGLFQQHYRAAVVTLRRLEHDDAITGAQLAEHLLQAGDTLLLLARRGFDNEWQDSKEFLVINPINSPNAEEELEPIRVRCPAIFPFGDRVETADGEIKKIVQLPFWYPYLIVPIFVAFISCAIAGYELAACALVGVIAIVGLNIITAEQAFSFVEVEVIVMVAFSFGLGSAMENSGFSAVIGQQVKAAGISGIKLLYLIAGLTTIMTNIITNKACVQVLIPLIIASYREQEQDPLPPVMMCCALASMALSTPHGFVTNLMVMGPGGYKPFDFIKFGVPLNVLATAVLPLITVGVYSMTM
jgi:di/tricarboxylate transporter